LLDNTSSLVSKLAARRRGVSSSLKDCANSSKSEQDLTEQQATPLKRQADDQSSSYFATQKHLAVEVESSADPRSATTQRKSGKGEPPHWREQLKNIELMRQHRDAPVDTMGCSSLGEKDIPLPVSDVLKELV
jgi:hypothetical protein